MTDYIYDAEWAGERRRLDTLASLYDEGTTRLLSALGVGAAWSCWEAGAGSGPIARWLAEQVGESGVAPAVPASRRS